MTEKGRSGVEEGWLMNKAGREGIWAGRGKVWLREAAVSICPPLLSTKKKKKLTVDDTVCRRDRKWLLYIRGLLPCAAWSQVRGY